VIKAAGYRVLVKKDEVEKETASGIVLVQDDKLQKHKLNTGVVIDVGPKAWKAFSNNYDGEPWAKVGDKVIFSLYAGFYVTDPDDEEEYTLLNDDDIVAVILTKEAKAETPPPLVIRPPPAVAKLSAKVGA